MKEIDWSKAPEGAQFWGEETFRYCEAFYKKVDHDWFYACEYRGWKWHSLICPPGIDRIGQLVRIPSSDWNGEGLPPVGTVCEFAGGTHCPEDPFDPDLMEGMEVKIIAHFKDGDSDVAAFIFNPRNLSRGNAVVEQGMHGCFRPARTREQIAAEERKQLQLLACADIETLLSQYNKSIPCSAAIRATVDAMIAAGYRKQEQPK